MGVGFGEVFALTGFEEWGNGEMVLHGQGLLA